MITLTVMQVTLHVCCLRLSHIDISDMCVPTLAQQFQKIAVSMHDSTFNDKIIMIFLTGMNFQLTLFSHFTVSIDRFFYFQKWNIQRDTGLLHRSSSTSRCAGNRAKNSPAPMILNPNHSSTPFFSFPFTSNHLCHCSVSRQKK